MIDQSDNPKNGKFENRSERSSELRSLILLSNSVPKSGSTFLGHLQNNFLLSVADSAHPGYKAFTEAGVKMSGGYVHDPNSEEFLNILTQGDLNAGPYVLKTHCAISEGLREVILGSNSIQMSLSIRDPLDIFYSARDNFNKTSEFSAFATEEGGAKVINGGFRRIFETTLKLNEEKQVPVVKYESIVRNPAEALISSFSESLRKMILVGQDGDLKEMAHRHMDLEKATRRASTRKNFGTAFRPDRARYSAFLEQELADVRRIFGYPHVD